ncbi:hypothetical protein ABZ916_38690 [Streptomyces sp. NPDC046853]|uniref:hypothetical protein n=1 Tax=Streptomyces sp. NPDC046853 TaxID=3154920 RepID=UPI0033FBCDA6
MSSPHDFDFFFGDWDVAHRRRKDFLDPAGEWEEFTAVSRCWSLFGGAANIDEMDCSGEGFMGLTLRLFDRETEDWSLNWSSSRSGKLFPPVFGRFGADGRGEFHGDDTYDGRPVRVRFVWSGISARTAVWEQAFSVDSGQTWLDNWSMRFTRRVVSGTT